jgi:DNA-binding Lrp family transcriptional regulator
MSMTLDDKDRRIVALLQENGRMTVQDLSERVGLSPTPCLRRLRQLEETGVITGYAAIVDEEAWGVPLTAFVSIRLGPHSGEHARLFEAKVQTMDNVLDCHLMTGEKDYLLRVVVKDLKEYEALVRQELLSLPYVVEIETSVAFGAIKRSHVYPRRT